MKIETKYKTGQEVWFWYDFKPRKGVIVSAFPTKRDRYMVRFEWKDTEYTLPIMSEKFFPTKEELLKSL